MFKLFAYLCSYYNLHVQIIILKFKLEFINITIFMLWEQTPKQEAADEGVEAVVMFMDEWDAAHRTGPDEGSSQPIPSLPNLTLKLNEESS